MQSYRGWSDVPCYPRGVKTGVDILLAGLAATATALLLGLIARDDIVTFDELAGYRTVRSLGHVSGAASRPRNRFRSKSHATSRSLLLPGTARPLHPGL